MSKFFWTSGHFGWAFFALMAFTALGFMAIDLVWRLTNTGIRKLVLMAVAGWIASIILILFATLRG